MCHEAQWRLPCSAESVGAGRRRIEERVTDWGLDPDDVAHSRLEVLALVASELVTNAVKACTEEIGLRLTAHRSWVEVAVSDDSPDPAEMKDPDPFTPGGRGLRIIEAVADDWGQYHHEGEKTVWARMSIPEDSRLVRDCH